MNKTPLLYKLLFKLFASVALLTTTLVANADRRHYDYARVTQATPIYQVVNRRVPVQSCWTETVAVDHHHSDGSALVGGLIGAAIGHNIGHNFGHNKHQRGVGTVAGAIIGASIADSGRRHRHTEYRDVKRCDTHYEVERQRELIGYDVTYRYRGDLYHTRTDSHPGDRIRVKVSVRPAH